MQTHEYTEEEVPLLLLYPLLQKVILSAADTRETRHTKTQHIIFFALSLYEHLTMSEIAGYISSSKEQATRAVAPLVDEGYILRSVNPENRTQVYISLTEKGLDHVKLYREKIHAGLNEMLTSAISAEEAEELRQAVRTILKILIKVDERKKTVK